uniref:RNA-directed RNA polymerase n=1 Tax=Hubei noda-like virus 15 TaxID=1922971 RepID=A0A1L3KG01_9VIRU|nr:hypothetical protein [Hubei noda-like virus 15]
MEFTLCSGGSAILRNGAWEITAKEVSRDRELRWWCLGVGAVIGGVAAYSMVKQTSAWRRFMTWTKDKVRIKAGGDLPKQFRDKFKQTKPSTYSSNHPHPASASLRTNAGHDIDSWITLQGYETYEVSGTSRGTNQGIDLDYTLRDATRSYKNDKLHAKHIIKMVDVDYYVDLPGYLRKGNPVIMYTFVPTRASGTVPDGQFTIINNKVHYNVNGGGKFEHELWDYSDDYVRIDTRWGFWVCRIDQMQYQEDPSRRVVLITPVVWLPGLWRSLYGESKTLERCKFSTMVDGMEWTIMQRTLSTGLIEKSIAQSGMYYCISIEEKLLASMLAKLAVAKHVHISDVERILRSNEYRQYALDAPFYLAYAVAERPKVVVSDVGYVPPKDHYYPTGTIVEPGLPVGTRLFDPIVSVPAVFPARGELQDENTVRGRIIAPTNNVVPTGVARHWVNDFVKLFPAGQHSPMTISEVHVIQNKHRQQVRSALEMCHGAEAMRTRPFMKTETYGEPKDARNITSVTTHHTLALSGYTYVFKEDVLKKQAWYMPCRTPNEIATAVQTFCQGYDSVINCDFSRFDGSLSSTLRDMEAAIYKRYFSGSEELNDMLKQERNCSTSTQYGVKYNTGHSRLSGSPLTTDGNTIISAFVAYCCARDAGMDIKKLDDIPCLAYGDDLMVHGVTDPNVRKVSQMFGLKIVADEVRCGQPLTFLGRVFPDPWVTETSFQDIKRTIAKLHLSVMKDIPTEIAVKNKALGYLATDSLTPLLSNICQWMLRNHPVEDAQWTRYVERFHDEMAKDAPYWATCDGSWPQHERDRKIMRICIADELGITVSTLRSYENRFKTATLDLNFVIELPENAPPTTTVVVHREEPVIEEAAITSQPALTDTAIRVGPREQPRRPRRNGPPSVASA